MTASSPNSSDDIPIFDDYTDRARNGRNPACDAESRPQSSSRYE
jgi:hypothetical protein